MKITLSLIEKLIRLRSGESLPASALRGEWVEELLGTQGCGDSGYRKYGKFSSYSSTKEFVFIVVTK